MKRERGWHASVWIGARRRKNWPPNGDGTQYNEFGSLSVTSDTEFEGDQIKTECPQQAASGRSQAAPKTNNSQQIAAGVVNDTNKLASRSAALSAMFAAFAVVVPLVVFWWQSIRVVRDLVVTITPERFEPQDGGDINVQFVFDNRGTKAVHISLIGAIEIVGKGAEERDCQKDTVMTIAYTPYVYNGRNSNPSTITWPNEHIYTYVSTRAREVNTTKANNSFIYGLTLPAGQITAVTGNIDVGKANYTKDDRVVFCPILKLVTTGEPQSTAVCQGWMVGQGEYSIAILNSVNIILPSKDGSNCTREAIPP